MTSADVVHSFGMAKYRVKEDVMPGRITWLWFYPQQPEESSVTCTEFCGTRHAYMYAPVKAVSEQDYEAWMKKMEEEA
jgi:cytochrome c oxidase subunit 2